MDKKTGIRQITFKEPLPENLILEIIAFAESKIKLNKDTNFLENCLKKA